MIVLPVALWCLIGIWIVPLNAFLQPQLPAFLGVRQGPGLLLNFEYQDERLRRRCRFFNSPVPPTSGRSRTRTVVRASSLDDFAEAEDLESLQALFAMYSDEQGLMTKEEVMQVPAIKTLMDDGDLLLEEFNDIWSKAPKFPEVKTSAARIDVDSFVQVYRDIDDLFEDDESSVDIATTPAALPSVVVEAEKPASVSAAVTPAAVDERDEEIMEAELESIFDSLCDGNKLVSKETVRAWDEVSKLMEDGLLDDEEFEDLWRKTKKSPGSEDKLDVDGFLSFNVALDGLFEFDDDEMNDAVDDNPSAAKGDTIAGAAPASLVEGEGIPTNELFRLLSSSDSEGEVTRDALLRWGELRELLDEGDLTESEVDSLFADASRGRTALDLNGLAELRKALDDLFEDVEDEELVSDLSSAKQDLLELLDDFSDPDLLPCGLDCTESEQAEVLKLVAELEREPRNLIRAQGGDVSPSELIGSWDLLYSSSSAMKFNKGLSGLGGSFPNGKFGGLKQVLKSSKFVSDVEYIERIEVNPSAASFDVKVTGDWELRRSVSLFTGEPSLVMTVEPGRVMYGPTSTKADHWKSLGPLNMLDISYLDEDLRIMRGNTSVDTIFIFRRSAL